MNLANFATYVGTAIGIIGVIIAIREMAAAKRASASETRVRKMYEEKCETRCKDLVDLVRGLHNDAISACMIIEENALLLIKHSSNDPTTVKSINTLSGNIKAIMTQVTTLKRLCARLNEEHQNEFGHAVYENIEECLGSGVCMPYSSKRK